MTDIIDTAPTVDSIDHTIATVTAFEAAPDAVTPSGTVIFVPLNKLKKSPRNARKVPHSEAHIEALAASIAAKGMLQNLVVEAVTDADGQPTGSYFVTIGEGRRLAQMLRAKRKQIKKAEPIRCVLDTINDPGEISLDENVTREAMHPADQFERFRELSENRGWGAEEIAARFGISPNVVKQRMRLGAVSPMLMQLYREDALTLAQLMAFAITDDHERQEQVYGNLSYNRDPSQIRRDLMRMNVPATDRRAVFVGSDAYVEAGGTIVRDLFTDDHGGFYEDASLLDQLALAKLEGIAAQVQADGWKWATAHFDYPHAHGLRRTYPRRVELSEEDAAALAAAQTDYDDLTAKFESVDELPEGIEEQFCELEAEIKRINAKLYAYDPDEVARGGVFVCLNHDGTARIERGFIRPEDEAPEPEETGDGTLVLDGVTVTEDGAIIGDEEEGEDDTSGIDAEEEEGDAGKPLSDLLIRDLTAHRTLGLRLALGEQPDMALIAVVHALAARTFYPGADASCLEIKLTNTPLATYAEGIEDSASAVSLSDRHAGWASDMPRDASALWDFVAGLDHASLMALLAHCAALTVNAVRLPWEQRHIARATAEKVATAVALDMTAHWKATKSSYLGRVTKAHILAAVRDGVGNEAAERITGLKKEPMVEAAEQLLAGTGWLPPLLRTTRPAWLDVQAESVEPEGDAYAEAAE